MLCRTLELRRSRPRTPKVRHRRQSVENGGTGGCCHKRFVRHQFHRGVKAAWTARIVCAVNKYAKKKPTVVTENLLHAQVCLEMKLQAPVSKAISRKSPERNKNAGPMFVGSLTATNIKMRASQTAAQMKDFRNGLSAFMEYG